MPRSTLLAAFLATSVLFLIGAASPASSSAASCQFFGGPTGWNGTYLYFGAQFNNCSHVDQIDMRRTVTGLDDSARWNDFSQGNPPGRHQTLMPPNADQYTFGRFGVNTTADGVTWYIAPWCGGAAHVISTEFIYRIHNMDVGGSWGPWHAWESQHYAITC